MWAALGEGPGLRSVLEAFYSRVFEDERLRSFFADTNKDWVIDKQYSFLRSIFTGEDGYFGMRPRNAHHWMVISDELFDYRESLLESCLRSYGLSEDLIRRFRAVDEVFRKQIVKDRPLPLVMNGVEKPADGYDTSILGVGTVCDRCGAEMSRGDLATYHLRTGRTFCERCLPAEQAGSEASALTV
jgi:truncated hemoglobin YjbI